VWCGWWRWSLLPNWSREWGSDHHELKEPAGDYASHSPDHGVAVAEVEEEAGMPEKV
jgi:hypothetical protein